MKDNRSTDKLGVNKVIRLFILPNLKLISNFLVLKCAACPLAFAMKYNPGEIKKYGIP